MTAVFAGCSAAEEPEGSDAAPAQGEELITIGFSQVGAESDWRKANSQSMIDTFTKDKGYELIFEDAQQKQQNQITAIRTFIQREVDYIVVAPVT
ncbi:MAG: LacI family transcriptional regulator, partial [Lachnospiraceae bacterium]|nr:LacI family transcriptional regulator [Lachnospiraceae bacterium]